MIDRLRYSLPRLPSPAGEGWGVGEGALAAVLQWKARPDPSPDPPDLPSSGPQAGREPSRDGRKAEGMLEMPGRIV